MSSAGGQFLLMLWKNYKLQSRRKIVTVFEIFIPLFFAVILLILRLAATNKYIPDYTLSPREEVKPDSYYWNAGWDYVPKIRIFYSPTNSFTKRMMAYVGQNLVPGIKANYTGFSNEQELLSRYNVDNNDVIAGVVFLSDTTKDAPHDTLDYKLRLTSDHWNIWRTLSTYKLRGGQGPETGHSPYGAMFISLQLAVNKAFTLELKPDAFNNVTFYTQKMPYPPYTRDSGIIAIQYLLSGIIVLSFIVNVSHMAIYVAYEKEKKLREAMKMMGLRTSVYWLSWFVKNLIYLVVVIILYTIIWFIDTSNGRLFPNTEPTLFFVFMFVYVLATIAFSFMISTFFKKANAAALAAGVLFYLSQSPANIVNSQYESMTRTQKMMTCLLHNMGMTLGINTILIAETSGDGYHWGNFHRPGQIGDNLSLLDTMIMMVFDTVLYMLIAWYVDTVNPGDTGVAQPLWFPFSPKYWCGSKAVDTGYEIKDDQDNNGNFEVDRSGARVGISVQHLRKRFGANVAVNDVTLNMYEGQITALLGHNGAGKTTTISMLIGFLKPSGGTASMYGKDIDGNLDEIRRDIGLCPQHNILFKSLTVEEHLVFFAKLKGCSGSDVNQEVNEMMKVLGLEEKRHTISGMLSGGQKRKLSVGIALVAGSKIVILDEPTSGMDPAARRNMWDILQRYRTGRTIILTTHFMDEADILGDRIAIMAHGKLQCCGTSMFLKKLYGAGYHLVVVKDMECDVDGLTQLIQTFIPTATLESHISSEISFLLPFNETEKFEGLFNEIEAKMSELKIRSFGTSATTMEEVFLRVGEGADRAEVDKGKQQDGEPGKPDEHDNSADGHNSEADSENTVIVNLTNTDYTGFNQGIKKYSGIQLILQQCYATFVKKFIHTRRNLAISISQLILPVAFVILALSTTKVDLESSAQSPYLNLDLHPFPNYVVGYSAGKYETPGTIVLAAQYGAQFRAQTKVDRQTFPTMEDYFKRTISDVGLPTYNREYIIAGDFYSNATTGELEVTAHYNGQPIHSIAISLQYAMNGFLKYVTNDTTKRISVKNHPLPLVSDSVTHIYSKTASNIDSALLVAFGLAFMTATFSTFYINERWTGAKHLQVVSGVGPVTYWLSSFAWDFVNYTIPALVILIVYIAFNVSLYVERLGYVFFVFMLYGWSALPFVYLVQHMFSKPAAGMSLISVINIITGLLFMAVVQILVNLPDRKSIGDKLHVIFLVFFPNYNLGQSLLSVYRIGKACANPYCYGEEVCCPDVLDMVEPGIGRECLAMFLQGLVYMLIVIVIELGLFRRLFAALFQRARGLVLTSETWIPDNDVSAECDRINSTPIQDLAQSESLILKNVSKVYNTGFRAVQNISCGIQANECFGLLGQNGAGKSTTLKMLTGEEMITSGDVFLNNLSLKTDLKQVHRNIGYCPQVDGLIDQMTGRETLYMYARLRGIRQADIPSTVNQLAESLMLTEHIDKKTAHYSGGNKRKLSTAISLIGDPPLILLDEPTTGLDPAARRQLWNVIAGVRASGRTVVLISHSMEECDALCTKLVIMVNGNFVCLGSPQHLKNKFGHGYTLFCRMGLDEAGNTASCQPLTQCLQDKFPGATVFDDNTGYVHFNIPDDNARLGQIFGAMEALKKQYNVEDYSVHQTSLEQIFLSFVKNQIAPSEIRPNCCVRCGCICFTVCC